MITYEVTTEAEQNDLHVFLMEHAVPATQFENEVISAILDIKNPITWQFEKNQICPSCNRNLTILDYLLSGILHHPIKFIRNEVCPDQVDTLQSEADVDPKKIARIDVVDSPIAITCTSGTVKHGLTYNLYAHAGSKGAIIRMSPTHYEAFKTHFNKAE